MIMTHFCNSSYQAVHTIAADAFQSDASMRRKPLLNVVLLLGLDANPMQLTKTACKACEACLGRLDIKYMFPRMH